MTAREERIGEKKTHLNIEGELTIYRASAIKEMICISLASNQDVEIDLSRVSEMDSAGLQLMLASKLESIARGTKLSFIGHSPAVREVMDICDLGGFFGDPIVMI
jgi:anti-sigma B factor antagonist